MIGRTVMAVPRTITVLGFPLSGLRSAACHEDGRLESGRVLISEKFKVMSLDFVESPTED